MTAFFICLVFLRDELKPIDRVKNYKQKSLEFFEASSYKKISYCNLICNSFNCFSSIIDGASIITSLPELFFGKAIKSRIVS